MLLTYVNAGPLNQSIVVLQFILDSEAVVLLEDGQECLL